MSLDETIATAVTQAVMKEIGPLIHKQYEDRIFDEETVLEMLGVSKQTLKRMREDGLVAYRPYGTRYYYFERDLKAFVKRKGRAL